MTLPPLSRDSAEEFRRIMREERGLELSHDEAAEMGTEYLHGIWATAVVAAEAEDRGAISTPEGRERRIAELFPEYAARPKLYSRPDWREELERRRAERSEGGAP